MIVDKRDFTVDFEKIDLSDLATVGGKNASLGELFQNLTKKGIYIPDGFAITAVGYWEFLDQNNLRQKLSDILSQLDTDGYSNLREVGRQAREVILHSTIPQAIKDATREAYYKLQNKFKEHIEVAVRSSATAEDLPHASFAGQQESYLNIVGEEDLLTACLHCYASLFTDRAIKYRNDNGFKHMDVALSISVQKMVRSDKACAGVCFTLEPETGFENIVLISGSWGLGENVVKGVVTPDEYTVFKPSLRNGKKAVISKKLGTKEQTLIYAAKKEATDGKSSEHVESVNNLALRTVNINTPDEKRGQFVLSDQEIELLAIWALSIEEHYGRPMDIEWAKDGTTGQMYIVQARPETVHANKRSSYIYHSYSLKSKGKVLTTGKNVGSKIAAGRARILHSPNEIHLLHEGEVLVTEITNPDWDPVLKKAAAIVTNRGGRTSHAAIVARETGATAVVGSGNATEVIRDGQEITVSCISGKKGVIYDGILEWEEKEIDIQKIKKPDTGVMFILADPDQAFQLSFLPNDGVGLMRLEFVINNTIQIHPMALVNFDQLEDKEAKRQIEKLTHRYKNKTDYFIDELSQAVATIAAAFYPKDVIVRLSDFKSNEYANLIGGRQFEPNEENPMLGWRGASRYYSDGYKEAFRLECEAMLHVRNDMGLNNIKLMIPFCRTVEEGQKVVDLMAQYGLERGSSGLEIYMMVEIPSNVLLAEEFAQIFDGFSIGSNDLTQLTLGIGRDSEILSDLFDVNNAAVKKSISNVIKSARKTNTTIGLCGQAPSDFPEFARFLVHEGINSISFSPDALFKGVDNINAAENEQSKNKQKQAKLYH